MVDIGDGLSKGYTWAQQHTITYTQLVFLVIALFLVWFFTLVKGHKPSARREPQMASKLQEENEAENSAVADAIHDGLFDAYCEGKISRERYRFECYRIGEAYNLPDLRPRKRPFVKASAYEMDRLKEEIKRRLPPEKVKEALARVKAKALPKPKGNGNKLNISLKGSQT